MVLSADELVNSIKKALVDREMAESLERVHKIYFDTQGRPVDKVREVKLITGPSPGRLVDRVCL